MLFARLDYLLVSSLAVLAGCAAQPLYVPLSPTHPASPWACESPVPPQTGTLAIIKEDMVPPHPDWQIPGMRDNEIHGHAAGSPGAMDMMGHGHMSGQMAGHSAHGGSGSSHAPGMVKMEAPRHQVDYAPKGAYHPSGGEPKEHEPELHLDHTDPARRAAPFQAAPVAPPMDHSDHEGSQERGTPGEHQGHQQPAGDTAHHNHKATPPEPAPASEPAPPSEPEPAQHDHGAMSHGPAAPSTDEATPPAEEPQPEMDHSQHGH